MTVASSLAQGVAAEVRAHMGRQDRSISDLAAAIGRTWPTAQSRYLGRTAYTFDELMAVCRWLDVPLSSLHCGETPDAS